MLQVFVTQAKYRTYQLNYYTSINKWSDSTPNESRYLLGGDRSELGETDEFMDDKNAEEVLLEILSGQNDNAVSFVEESSKSRIRLRSGEMNRRRRSTEDRNRELNMANLVKGGENSHIDPDLKIRWIVSSDNPDYEPSKSPPVSEEDVQENVKDIPQNEINQLAKESQLFNSPSKAFALMRSTFSGAINWLVPEKSSDEQNEEGGAGKSDPIVLRDWRRSNCIGPVRDQGYCASCYAFSAISYLEWALCSSRNSEFTPLSVQYIVSCGKQLETESHGAVKLYGCKYGVSKNTQDFIREYGVELEVNMPYVARETQCPVEMNSPRKKKGYIRPNVKPPMRLSPATSQLDLALKLGPVVVSMREPIDFLAYGGGLVENCEPTGGHAMLIVGNMIEDDEEYLLIKNSFGFYWGYQGFFKFRRSSIQECVKEFIVPMISFPGRKSQARHVKAYVADRQSKSLLDQPNEEESVYSFESLISGHEK